MSTADAIPRATGRHTSAKSASARFDGHSPRCGRLDLDELERPRGQEHLSPVPDGGHPRPLVHHLSPVPLLDEVGRCADPPNTDRAPGEAALRLGSRP